MAKNVYIATRSFSGENFSYAAGDEVKGDSNNIDHWLEIGFIREKDFGDIETAQPKKTLENSMKKSGRK